MSYVQYIHCESLLSKRSHDRKQMSNIYTFILYETEQTWTHSSPQHPLLLLLLLLLLTGTPLRWHSDGGPEAAIG